MSIPKEQSVKSSAQLLKRAERVDASFVGRPGVLGLDFSQPIYPVFAERARGAYVWDSDGNRYLDFILGFGSVVLGHADPRVDGAVRDELSSGIARSLHTPTQLRLAELLVDVAPGAEMVTLHRTGSDATGAAVRLARACTGRPYVLRWGYNGWHDWCAARPNGLPPGAQDCVRAFDYNDTAGLKALLDEVGDQLACVIMMPYEIEAPAPGYLAEVAELTRNHGGLFILDEIRSGFRLAPGGAQEHFGVRADLVTYSKAMANGYAVSAVTGTRDIMRHARRISCSSTFFRSSDAMAAAVATIDAIRGGGTTDVLWERGRQLMRGLAAAADDCRVPAGPVGLAPTPYLEFHYPSGEERRLAAEVFYATTLRAGVLFHPGHHWFVCEAMTSQDIDLAVRAAHAGFAAVAAAVGQR
ncbi:aminotransferase class III-fold pyridoxal phosphate-dependent enzyme [Streptomyces antimycoticus]|uniref:aminotransferase class III-fold pyridoxal phosphate-dependent enzyme n=1 Tax=Streptomyces antimycoticus TaxID=68175 RepID=UPI000A39AE91|nr:aminotransferase class III-fold pyridoxal phosphate-dependent enzyme [Streptomyces antimycoticus]